MSIFENLKKLSDEQSKFNFSESLTNRNTQKENKENSKRKDPSYIYLDENDQIKEIPLSKLDSAGSALINRKMKQNPAKIIHDSLISKHEGTRYL